MTDTTAAASPLIAIYQGLRDYNAAWHVEIGVPDEPGWIKGGDLRTAECGPFNELLLRIGTRIRTADRRTIAASFALRYGWASAMAIGPCLRHACVPDVSLDNISLKFKDSTFFERAALHVPRGAMLSTNPGAVHSSIRALPPEPDFLLRDLRRVLTEQAQPVVAALHEWSGFAPRGTWGMLTSSWAAHFTALCGEVGEQRDALPLLRAFFTGDDLAAELRPRFHTVTCDQVTHVYQRRASCCRFYLLPWGELCASCPLVSHEERVQRNLVWMKRQLDTTAEKRSHS